MLLGQWTPISALSLAKVTVKVVMLMALVSAQRVQTLQKLRIDRMVIAAEAITFYVYDLPNRADLESRDIGCFFQHILRTQDYV